MEVKRPVSDRMLGMIFFISTEAMFFAGLISAFIVCRAGASAWPPVGQPRLPVEVTGLNTFILLFSAFSLILFLRRRQNPKWLYAAFACGLAFLLIQGFEWMQLLGFGLKAAGSLYGAFFYLLIGAHALHVLAGLIMLGTILKAANKDTAGMTNAFSFYWFFVVAVWPVLYLMVYF